MKIKTSRHMKKLAPFLLAVAGFVFPARATITVQDLWHVGEDAQTVPTDSVGTHNFYDGWGATIDTLNYAPGGSTASLSLNNGALYMAYTGDGSWVDVPSDNWVFEMWINLASTSGDLTLAALGNTSGESQIGITGGNYYFGEANVSYGIIGPAATTGVWTELAWVRSGGVNYAYINGVEIGSDSNTPDNNGLFNLFVKPGGGESPTGNLDEVRFSTFNPGEFSASDLMVSPVPEPGILALAGMGGLMFLAWNRRRA